MDKLLYGYNTEERIVAVHQLNDQTIRLYKRMEGKVLHQDVEFFPFFLLSHEALIKGFPKKFWLKELNGGNFYRYIAAFTRWSEMWEAVHFILHQYNQNHSPRTTYASPSVGFQPTARRKRITPGIYPSKRAIITESRTSPPRRAASLRTDAR